MVAGTEGWARSTPSRSFLITKCEYAEEYLHTDDYDVGAEQALRIEAVDEADLSAAIAALGLAPSSFHYPWDTDDPM